MCTSVLLDVTSVGDISDFIVRSWRIMEIMDGGWLKTNAVNAVMHYR